MPVSLARFREKCGTLLDWLLCRTFSPWIGKLLKPGALIFDVGAHRGSKTARFLSRGSRVVMVEPQPKMIKILKKKYQENKNVFIEACALGKKNGQGKLYTATETPGISTLSRKWIKGRFRKTGRWNAVTKVRIKTLDGLIKKYGVPDWIKIDVEGFEEKVLAGLSKKAGIISFEFSEESFAVSRGCAQKLLNLGYREFTFSTRGKDRFDSPWLSWRNTLAVISQSIKEGRSWGDIFAQ